MINPLSIVFRLTRARSYRERGHQARRFKDAFRAQPALLRDIIELGGVMKLAPQDEAGRMAATPEQLAYDQGRRDFALELLALGSITNDDIEAGVKHHDD